MADSILIQVADAITKELNQGSFSLEFQAERSYADWDDLLSERGQEVRVDVVPVSQQLTLETRGSWEYRVPVDIGVRFRFPQDHQDPETRRVEKAEVDRLTDLVQEIGEHFAPKQPSQDGRPLEDLPDAVWAPDGEEGGTAYRATYVREHLRQHRQFTGIIRLTFLVPK